MSSIDNDLGQLQKIAAGDPTDMLLSVGRAQRILDHVSKLDQVRKYLRESSTDMRNTGWVTWGAAYELEELLVKKFDEIVSQGG